MTDRNPSAVTILISLLTIALLLGTATATLLRRTHVTRLARLIALPAFLAMLPRLRAATLLILATLVLALLPVARRALLLLIAPAFLAQLPIPVSRIVSLVRHVEYSRKSLGRR